MDLNWKARAQCFFFNVDVIGSTPQLIHRAEDTLFDNFLQKNNPEDALRGLADTEIETVVENIKRAPIAGKDIDFVILESELQKGTYTAL